MTHSALLQSELSGVATFFLVFFTILIIMGGSGLFTYWISKTKSDGVRRRPPRKGVNLGEDGV